MAELEQLKKDYADLKSRYDNCTQAMKYWDDCAAVRQTMVRSLQNELHDLHKAMTPPRDDRQEWIELTHTLWMTGGILGAETDNPSESKAIRDFKRAWRATAARMKPLLEKKPKGVQS